VHKLAASNMSRPVVYALAADAELLDKRKVGLAVVLGDVLQVALALTNQLQQTAAGSKVFLVYFEMLGEFFDPLGSNAHLHSGAAGVGFVVLQLLHHSLFLLTCNHTLAILSDELREGNPKGI